MGKVLQRFTGQEAESDDPGSQSDRAQALLKDCDRQGRGYSILQQVPGNFPVVAGPTPTKQAEGFTHKISAMRQLAEHFQLGLAQLQMPADD